MSYLIGEMLIYLFCVALLGIIVGWLFTRASYKRKIEDAEVVLLSQLHDVTTQLDLTQQQLDKTTKILEEERVQGTGDFSELQQLQVDFADSRFQHDERKQQALDLKQSLDEAKQQLQQSELKFKEQEQENQKMTRDSAAVKNRLSVFQSDLDEIVEQSSILRAAFEQARLDLVARDKRISELESMSSEGLQMAALSANVEPELAISRIARLQTRVQELFDEVGQKDKEIEKLKGSSYVDRKSSVFTNIADLQADDLQLISGIGGFLENKLNNLGITRFSDISHWDDAEIDRIDQELDFHGRIKRENWVEQARKLDQSGSSSLGGH